MGVGRGYITALHQITAIRQHSLIKIHALHSTTRHGTVMHCNTLHYISR
jgi:hypothetical protein